MRFLIFLLLIAVPVMGAERNVRYDTDTGTVVIPSDNLVLPGHAYSKTAPPTPDDDLDEGYYVGSVWIDVNNEKSYICLDNTNTQAVWTEITQSGGGGGGDVTKVGTPVDNQLAVWTGDGTIEGEPNITFSSSTFTLGAGSNVTIGSDQVLLESEGLIALQNISSLDFETEATIEGAIDTLASLTAAVNLVSIGTIGNGTWEATDIGVAHGGTGASTAAAARTNLGLVIGTDVQAYSAVLAATTASFLTADETKLDGIESGADVTDTANVTSAGALMDSEVDADIKTLALPANVTISAFGQSLVDDDLPATARATLGVDPAGTDNSTDVTLGGTPDYITLAGQVLVRNAVDLAEDVTGVLPAANLPDADDDGSTQGVASFDNTHFDATAGNVTLASVAGVAGADEDDVTAADLGSASANIAADGTIEWEDATDLDANGALNTGSVDSNELASTAVVAGTYQIGMGGSITVDGDGRLTDATASGTYKTMFVSASAMAPRETNGAAFSSKEFTTNDVQVDTMLFDGATDEAATFQIMMPDAWDLGTLKIKVFWTGTTGMSENDTIELEISARAFSNDDAIDTAFSSPVTITDNLIAIGDNHVTAASSALTVQGTPALGDMILFQILRDISVAPVPEDLTLIGIAIQWRELTTATAVW